MVNIQKQIDYWINGAEDDIITANLLIQEKRTLHGLFFCHLVIEKAIKAHFVKNTKEVAPRSHNLLYLSEKAEIDFDDETLIFIGILMKYQLQGRYPDYNPVIPDPIRVDEYFNKTKALLQWLKMKL
jgi:HEPN domain-containing protein